MKMLAENSIGSQIKFHREKKKLSQTELVERLAEEKDINMSRETLSKIENDSRTLSAIELKAICSILKVHINDILGSDEDSNDLVTLFRRKGDFSEKTIKQIEELQDMIKIFISQEAVFKGQFKPKKNKPLWEEFE